MISVIIPMYNASKYIRETIDSILLQDYKEFEILLVDDGSTDDTSKICKEYQQNDNRIKYLYKSNSGVSATRNYGINHSSGEYIMFIDSDDYIIDNQLFSKCINVVDEHSKVMPIFNFTSLRDNGETLKQDEFNIDNPKVEDIMAICISGIKNNFNLTYMFRTVWGKLFNRNIIEKFNIRFDESMYMGEDAVFLLQYIPHIESIKDIHTYGLLYRVHDDSASRKYKADLMAQAKLEVSHFNIILSNYDSKLLTTARTQYIWITYRQLFINELRGNKKHIEGKKWLDFNREHLRDKVDYSKMNKVDRVYIFIYKCLPFMLIPLMKFYFKIKMLKFKKVNRSI